MSAVNQQKLDELKQQLKDAQTRSDKIVLVLGPYHSGKSTAINYLLGHTMQLKAEAEAEAEEEISIGKFYQQAASNSTAPVLPKDTPERQPNIVTHEGVCYVELPDLVHESDDDLLANYYKDELDAAAMLSELTASLAQPLSFDAALVIMNESDFMSGSTKDLQNYFDQLSQFLRKVKDPNAIHLVFNNLSQIENIIDEISFDELSFDKLLTQLEKNDEKKL